MAENHETKKSGMHCLVNIGESTFVRQVDLNSVVDLPGYGLVSGLKVGNCIDGVHAVYNYEILRDEEKGHRRFEVIDCEKYVVDHDAKTVRKVIVYKWRIVESIKERLRQRVVSKYFNDDIENITEEQLKDQPECKDMLDKISSLLTVDALINLYRSDIEIKAHGTSSDTI